MRSRILLRRILIGLMPLLFILVRVNVSSAQVDQYGRWENGISEAWSFTEGMPPDEIATVQTRWKLISDENKKSLTSEWSGDYFVGSEVHGTYMRWSLQNGFVFIHVDKCAARVMGFSYGKAIASPAVVQFINERTVMAKQTHNYVSHSQKTSNVFLTVKWYGTHYLVPDNEIASFGDYASGLGRYNFGLGGAAFGIDFFYKKTDKSEGAVNDAPIVPHGYERFIKKPIDAKVIAVRRSYVMKDVENKWWNNLITPVTLDAGSLQGVKTKMTLNVVGSEHGEMVEVRQVGLRVSKGVIIRSVRKKPCVKFSEADDCKDPEYTKVQAGWAVTTNPLK